MNHHNNNENCKHVPGIDFLFLRSVVYVVERKREARLLHFALVRITLACVHTDVLDAVIEVSAGPADAVSALAGMSLACTPGDEAPIASAKAIASSAVGTTGSSENSQAAAASASSAAMPIGDAYGGSKRHAMTLGAMQAQWASGVSGSSPSGDEGLARAEAQKGVVVSGGASRDNAELEKVSAFISSYAGTTSCTEVCTDIFKQSGLGRRLYSDILVKEWRRSICFLSS